jgi:hypothetical protein
MLRRSWGFGVALAGLFAASAALACEGKTVLFEDEFEEYGSAWGNPGKERSVENGKMILNPEAGYTSWTSNNSGLYDDIDFCIDLVIDKPTDKDNSFAGVMFWHEDHDNFYMFVLTAGGEAEVRRMQKGRWLTQVDWEEAEDAKTGSGVVNTLRVVTKGNVASYYVNGKLFAEGKGAPPADGQLIGVIASSPKKGAVRYEFQHLKITEPE